MKRALFSLLVFLCAACFSGRVNAQAESGFGYCHLFYLTSDQADVLPFDNVCFVRDSFSVSSFRHIRVKGPIERHVDLFKGYEWAINFFLPDVKGPGKMVVKTPENMEAGYYRMPAGTCFITLSDNRSRQRSGPKTDEVDFAAVSGKLRIAEYEQPSDSQSLPSYNLHMDITVRQVDRSGGGASLTGPEIKLKGVLVMKAGQ